MKKFLVLIFSFFILCGFNVKTDTYFRIDTKKNVSVSIYVRIKDDLLTKIMYNSLVLDNKTKNPARIKALDVGNVSYTDEEKMLFLKKYFRIKGKTVSDLEEGNFNFFDISDEASKGYFITLNLGKLDELLSDEKILINNIIDLENNKIFNKDGNVYSTNINLNFAKSMKVSKVLCSRLGFENNIYVDLPNEVIETNAHSVDSSKKILSWVFNDQIDEPISFSFEFIKTLDYTTEKPILLVFIFSFTILVVVFSTKHFIKNIK